MPEPGRGQLQAGAPEVRMNRFRCLSVALTFAAAATPGLGADRRRRYRFAR